MSELETGSEIKITDRFSLIFNRGVDNKSYCYEKGHNTPLLFFGLEVERENNYYIIV